MWLLLLFFLGAAPAWAEDLGALSANPFTIRAIYRDGYRYKKAGMMLTDLDPASQRQADLFDYRDRGKSKRLMSALDSINDRWGTGTLHYASSGIRNAWKTQLHRRSPTYTTDWNALPVVNA
jgi:DNA polymerase V